MARNLPLYARPAAALILPLTLLAAPVAAQTSVKEDSVVLQPDKVTDDAPEIETVAEANLPSWSVDNAKALLAFIQSAGDEGLFPKDYNPDALKAAIDGGNQITLDKVATDSFLLLATHMRDGRTPNAARKQWFMTDGDAQTEPLIPLLGSAKPRSRPQRRPPTPTRSVSTWNAGAGCRAILAKAMSSATCPNI